MRAGGHTEHPLLPGDNQQLLLEGHGKRHGVQPSVEGEEGRPKRVLMAGALRSNINRLMKEEAKGLWLWG